MDLYHIWCNLQSDVSDMEFCESVDRYLGQLREAGRIAEYRLTRDVKFALYRDFPDPQRERGGEKF